MKRRIKKNGNSIMVQEDKLIQITQFQACPERPHWEAHPTSESHVQRKSQIFKDIFGYNLGYNVYLNNL